MTPVRSKHIISYIIKNKDSDVLASVSAYKHLLFEQDEAEVYNVLEGIFNTQHIIPDLPLLKNYALSKGGKALLKDMEFHESIHDVKSATLAINSLLYQSFIDFVSIDAKTMISDLAKSDITEFQIKAQDFLSDMSNALSFSTLKQTRESVIYGDEYVNKSRARYAKNKMNEGYIVCKFGYSELDRQLGGIANNDFINILAYVKQFKSTLMRNIAYNALLQGKNILFLTLEMSDEEVEAEFQAIHASNKVRFGTGRPVIKSEDIKNGTLSDEAEDFLFNEVIPDMANSDDLGILKVINPSEGEYFQSDMYADIDRTLSSMDIDIIFLDYLTMVKPKGTYDKQDVNDMFKYVRKRALTSRIPIINAVQANRAAYNAMLEDEFHRYGKDSAGDYNEIERSSTVISKEFELRSKPSLTF